MIENPVPAAPITARRFTKRSAHATSCRTVKSHFRSTRLSRQALAQRLRWVSNAPTGVRRKHVTPQPGNNRQASHDAHGALVLVSPKEAIGKSCRDRSASCVTSPTPRLRPTQMFAVVSWEGVISLRLKLEQKKCPGPAGASFSSGLAGLALPPSLQPVSRPDEQQAQQEDACGTRLRHFERVGTDRHVVKLECVR